MFRILVLVWLAAAAALVQAQGQTQTAPNPTVSAPVTGPGPIAIDPPVPYADGLATIRVTVPGASGIRVSTSGAGCGEIGSMVVDADTVAWTARTGQAGTCTIDADAAFGRDVVEVTSHFRVQPRVGSASASAGTAISRPPSTSSAQG